MNTVSVQQILNDDGTLRRKYEIEEQEESRYLFSATIGFVLASIIIYLKNLLFGEENEDPHIERSSGSNTAGEDVIAGDDALEDVIPDKSEKEQFDDPYEEGPGFVKLLFTTTSASYIAGVSYLPDSFVPANDNIKVLDAVFGIPVMTFPGGGFGNSAPSAGGNVPSGGNYDGDNDEEYDIDEDEDEDQDDDPRPTNRLPVVTGPVYLGSFFMNQAVIIGLSDLLRNVSDLDGDALSVRELHTSSGNLSVRHDGSWAFSPDLDDTTDVTFTYNISDGKGGTAQTAILDLVPTHDRPIEGTDGDDSIVGTPRDDVIDARSGDDTIIGREGNDVIHGGDGNDRIVAGEGDDVVYGGAGNDVVFAGPGRDTVFAGIGNDIIFGDEGNDSLFGEEGSDTVSGGSGDDTIEGGEGEDTLTGGAGNDLIDGGAGIDNIDGGEDQDTILAGAGDDTASGGAGNDLFIAFVADGNDAYDGGEGTDTYDISATSADAIIDLRNGTARSDEIGDDEIENIENVRSGSGDDTITGGEGDDNLAGGAGDDLFIAAAGDGSDAYDGGEGIDTYDISATSTDAIIDLREGTARSNEIGDDDIDNFENANGGTGDDIIFASENVNIFRGGEGDDSFVFGSVAAAGRGYGLRDRILDFAVGDRIDLDDISAEFAEAIDATFEDQNIRRFVLIREQDNFTRPGQIKFSYDTFDGNPVTIIQGNIDYDEDAEFELELAGTYQLGDDDFWSRNDEFQSNV